MLNLTSGLMSTAIPLTQPVITHSSAGAEDAADISSMKIANPRKNVHFVYCKLKNSCFLIHYFLIHMLNSQVQICPEWGTV
jgi:hypothetical protein